MANRHRPTHRLRLNAALDNLHRRRVERDGTGRVDELASQRGDSGKGGSSIESSIGRWGEYVASGDIASLDNPSQSRWQVTVGHLGGTTMYRDIRTPLCLTA
jgi:hypothetical protein